MTRKMLKEERELRNLISKRWGATNKGSIPTVIGLAINDFRRAVREDERKAMSDPKNWPDWKIAFVSDVYGRPFDEVAAAIRKGGE